MIIRSLKATFFLNLVIILFIAMVLINVVITNTLQRELVRGEIDRARRIIAAVDALSGPSRLAGGDATLSPWLQVAGVTGYYHGAASGKQADVFIDKPALSQEFQAFARRVTDGDNERIEFRGSGWGVFWKQDQELWIASAKAGMEGNRQVTALILPLKQAYLPLRKVQRHIFLFIAGNTIFFSLIGLYGLVRIVLHPVQRLARRVETFQEDDPFPGRTDRTRNEFGQLSRALTRMMKRISGDREKLKTSIHSLEAANAELKKAQREIIKAEKMASIGRLSAGIAHEIGNPLGIVLGYLNLLKQNGFSAAEKTEFITRAQGEVTRINAIIRQLLDFARGSGKDQKEPVLLEPVIQEVCDLIRHQPLLRGVDVQCRFSSPHGRILANPDQVRQLFLNLLINAGDAVATSGRKDNGRIRVQVGPAPSSGPIPSPAVEIHVEDNGRGICEQDLDLIFDPFFTTKEPGKGTGLGLAVCFMIVDSMGGKIEAESREGEGTCMKVYLPACTKAEMAVSRPH